MNPSLQDQQDHDQAAYHADMLLWLQEGQDALDASATRPLGPTERAVLAFLAGLKD